MKKIILLLVLSLSCSVGVYAQNNVENLVYNTTKYYKTIDNYSFEITQEEYDAVDESNRANPVETTYKKMTTSIISVGSQYKYKVVLNWKLMPSTRSYDIIGIGHLSNVKIDGNPTFEQYYCTSLGCTTSTSYTKSVFNTGITATFALPSGSITTLKETFSFKVKKNTTSTITYQLAVGDYSHATSTISLTNALKHSINPTSGIVLDSSISSYYDSISFADVSWTGTW